MRELHWLNTICSRFLRQLLLVPLLLAPSLAVDADEAVEHFRSLGQKLCDQKQYTDSISAFDRAIMFNPKDASLYSQRSDSYEKCTKYPQASADMRTAMKLDPKNSKYCIKYADLGDLVNDQRQAIDGINRYLAISPDDWEFISKRAYKYRLINDFDRALADSTNAIAVAKKVGAKKAHIAELYKRRGQLLAWRKDFGRALADFTSGLELNPDDHALHKNRADSYIASGQKRKAIEDLTFLVSREKKTASLLDDYGERARLYLELKDNPKALADANSMIALVSDFIDAFKLRAQIYEAMAKHDLAKKDLETVRKLGDDWMPPKY